MAVEDHRRQRWLITIAVRTHTENALNIPLVLTEQADTQTEDINFYFIAATAGWVRMHQCMSQLAVCGFAFHQPTRSHRVRRIDFDINDAVDMCGAALHTRYSR